MTRRQSLTSLVLRGTLLLFGCAGPVLGCNAAPKKAPTVTAAAPTPTEAAPAKKTDAAEAHHLLGRFAFGPRPGDVERVRAEGAEAWLERQLAPDEIDDAKAAGALEPYRDAFAPPRELYEEFEDMRRARRDAEDGGKRQPRRRMRRYMRDLTGNGQMSVIARHLKSERQVHEVMVDFWTNHFNVFARKGPVKFVAIDYVEKAIRPHALGRFEDMLLATARHPAMLVYLDNAQSVAEREDRPGRKRRRGLNENYARELLELHTLGVDGGYEQKDIVEVARVLTGWSMGRPRRDWAITGPEFQFRARAHDDGKKVVLGVEFPENGGEEEGVRLLKMLAAHPSTARHLSRKLCERFVADSPPPACVDTLARTYIESRGDVRALLRAVARSPEFWKNRRNKLKSPLELVLSGVRALGGSTDGTLGLAEVTARLGQPLLLQPAPTGYPEAAADWLGTSAMLQRMKFATALGAGELSGVSLELDSVVAPNDDDEVLLRNVESTLFPPGAGARTLEVIRSRIVRVNEPSERRTIALALALGSPEFQRQ